MKMRNFFKIFMLAGLLTNVFVAAAQDGEQLFKKCFTCHTLGKKSTGPDLVGVRAKWVEAGEGDMLADWVMNSDALITSGKSKMANAAKEFSPTMMPPQDVTKEDVNAIFDYIDSWKAPEAAAPAAAAPAASTAPAVVKYVPNYNRNYTIFMWMVVIGGILIFAIMFTSKSITTLVKSDYFRERIAKKGNGSTTVLSIALFIAFLFGGNELYALTFNGPGAAMIGEPWLKVEDQDLYTMLIIDLILLGVLFYVKSMFNKFLAMVRKDKAGAKQRSSLKKLNKVLTDAVDIEDEHTILMDHEYDGIRELDNNMPTWWLWMFYATIAFSVIYVFHYHVFKTGDLQAAEYDKVMIAKQAEIEEYMKNNALNIDENSVTLLEESADLDKGKELYTSANCVVCHNPDGSGKIGPNLTDKNWIYGYDIKEVFATIKNGTANGMPEHAAILTPKEIQQVASYVLHLAPAAGKEAEGDIVKP